MLIFFSAKEILDINNEAKIAIFNKNMKSEVLKTGKSTGITNGYIYNRKLTIEFWQGKGHYKFSNCYGIKSNNDHDHFAKIGDSGSGVFLVEKDNTLKPLGLFFAYIGKIAVVCKIGKILDELDLKIVKYKTTSENHIYVKKFTI